MKSLFKIIIAPLSLRCYGYAIALFIMLPGFKALAQNPEGDNYTQKVKIDLKITDNASKATHTYKLLGSSYSVSKPFILQKEGSSTAESNCTLILELAQNADDFLLKWVAGTINDIKGEITIADVNVLNKPRIITFTNWEVASASESFYSTNEAMWWPHVSVYVKTLTVDGIKIFPGAKTTKR